MAWSLKFWPFSGQKEEQKAPEPALPPPTPRNDLDPPSFGSSFSKVIIETVQPPIDEKSESDGATYCWIIFICATSRALHLELVKPADSASMINSINRAFALNGFPEKVVFYPKHHFQSNQDTARKRLELLLPSMSKICNFTLINAPKAPLWNGFYSMMYHTVSFALRSFEPAEGHEIEQLKKITEIINSRPIMKLGSRAWELITPEHLLAGNCSLNYPKVTLECNELVQFWKKWSLNYLTWLKEFHNLRTYLPVEGELVLLWNSHLIPRKNSASSNDSNEQQIHDEQNQNSHSQIGFNIAVIEELFGTMDGLPCRARIRLECGETLTQELQHLIPLECAQGVELAPLLNSVLLLQEEEENAEMLNDDESK